MWENQRRISTKKNDPETLEIVNFFCSSLSRNFQQTSRSHLPFILNNQMIN